MSIVLSRNDGTLFSSGDATSSSSLAGLDADRGLEGSCRYICLLIFKRAAKYLA